MGNLFERISRTVGSFRTTKTMNKKTGRVKTKITRVKPKVVKPKAVKPKIRRSRSGPRK